MSRAKSILIAIGVLVLIALILVVLKGSQIYFLVNNADSLAPPNPVVSVTEAVVDHWSDEFSAVGTIEADEGIVLTAEVAGRVSKIYFASGQQVSAGDLLLEQEAGNEKAQLAAVEARLALAQNNFKRIRTLRTAGTVSQSEMDAAQQQLASTEADANDLRTTLRKKMIRAPFAGKIGIRQVDVGRDLQVGTEIASLQSTQRVRVNFPVPQEWLAAVTTGLAVTVSKIGSKESLAEGVITASDADINTTSRSAKVQASLDNQDGHLIPGMAVEIKVVVAQAEDVLIVPSSAIIYAPFGDTVFVVERSKENAEQWVVRQQFVRLGRQRGDFVQIENGLVAGEQVVDAGGFKVINGQQVSLTDRPVPKYELNAKPENK